MSAVTLETLRADFEAARLSMVMYATLSTLQLGSNSSDTQLLNQIADEVRDLEPEEAEKFARHPAVSMYFEGEAVRLCSAAAIYLIARDHGLQAAMLCKLSDGAIDPREGGAA